MPERKPRVAPLDSRLVAWPYHVLLVLPTRGRLYLYPARTYRARERLLGRHGVVTRARFLQRAGGPPPGWPPVG